ncbi:L-arabinose transport system permease protein AraQ [subsurface metagenome]
MESEELRKPKIVDSEELRKSKKRKKVREVSNKTIYYILLSVFGLTMIFPFLWMVSTSLKEPGDVFTYPPEWIPDPVVFQNYPEAWNAVPFGRAYVNSSVIAIVVTLGQVFTSSLAAYAFARLQFPGRDKLFLAYLATMMIPGAVTMIPVFILLKVMPEILDKVFNTEFWSTARYMGPYFVGKPIGIDSYFALIVPGFFSAYGTFMLRQFFMGIPRDLEDAARIDGCSKMGTYFRIILPLSKPALATLTIFTFMGSWRAFMWPLIVTSRIELQTLPIMLASFQGLYKTDWTLLMAASIIVMVPMLIVFIFGQRFFISGIRLGAIKG